MLWNHMEWFSPLSTLNILQLYCMDISCILFASKIYSLISSLNLSYSKRIVHSTLNITLLIGPWKLHKAHCKLNTANYIIYWKHYAIQTIQTTLTAEHCKHWCIVKINNLPSQTFPKHFKDYGRLGEKGLRLQSSMNLNMIPLLNYTPAK